MNRGDRSEENYKTGRKYEEKLSRWKRKESKRGDSRRGERKEKREVRGKEGGRS